MYYYYSWTLNGKKNLSAEKKNHNAFTCKEKGGTKRCLLELFWKATTVCPTIPTSHLLPPHSPTIHPSLRLPPPSLQPSQPDKHRCPMWERRKGMKKNKTNPHWLQKVIFILTTLSGGVKIKKRLYLFSVFDGGSEHLARSRFCSEKVQERFRWALAFVCKALSFRTP